MRITAEYVIASAFAYALNFTVHYFVMYFGIPGRQKVLCKTQFILIIQLGNKETKAQCRRFTAKAQERFTYRHFLHLVLSYFFSSLLI